MITSYAEMFTELKNRAGKNRVALPMADDEAALQAVADAKRQGLAEALLLGPAKDIERLLKRENLPPADFELVDVSDAAKAAELAVNAVREGQAQLILKGNLSTADLLKAVLDKEQGLRTGRLLSDVYVYENPLPGRKRLVGLTDGGVNIAPDLPQKREILQNAVCVFHRLGLTCPKVACLCAVEKVNPKMQATLDAQELVELNRRGEIAGCLIEGPFAVDNALDKECAKAKGLKSEVAGDADILLAPNIEAGNIYAKAIQYHCNITPGHVIMGAKAPILINSRVDSRQAKLNSIALSVLSSNDA